MIDTGSRTLKIMQKEGFRETGQKKGGCRRTGPYRGEGTDRSVSGEAVRKFGVPVYLLLVSAAG